MSNRHLVCRMKGDFQVWFSEKFGVKIPVLTRLRGRRSMTSNLLYQHGCNLTDDRDVINIYNS